MKKYLFIVLLVGVWSCEDDNVTTLKISFPEGCPHPILHGYCRAIKAGGGYDSGSLYLLADSSVALDIPSGGTYYFNGTVIYTHDRPGFSWNDTNNLTDGINNFFTLPCL